MRLGNWWLANPIGSSRKSSGAPTGACTRGGLGLPDDGGLTRLQLYRQCNPNDAL